MGGLTMRFQGGFGMKKALLTAGFAALAVALVPATVNHGAIPEQFHPKIVKTSVTRSLGDLYTTEWTYVLRLDGTGFTRKSKIEVDGEKLTGKYEYVMSNRDVQAIRVVLGTWSRVYQKPKAHQVNVVDDENRSEAVEVTW